MKIICPATCAVIGHLKAFHMPDISQFVSLAKAIDHGLMHAPESYESEWYKPILLCFFDVFGRLGGTSFENDSGISQLDKSIDTAAAYICNFL